MIEYLNQIDWEIFHFLNSLRHPVLDEPFMNLSGRFTWVPMYCAIMLVLIRTCTWRQVVIYSAAVAVAITLTDQTCATYLRPAIERLRPSNPQNPLSEFVFIVDNYRGGPYGFPSCHAANSFALAVFITRLIPCTGFRLFMFSWATIHAYSRIYLGVHYPGDLLVGVIIGSFFGWLCYRIARKFDTVDRSALTEKFASPRITLQLGSHGLSQGRGSISLPVYHLMSFAFILTLLSIAFFAIF